MKFFLRTNTINIDKRFFSRRFNRFRIKWKKNKYFFKKRNKRFSFKNRCILTKNILLGSNLYKKTKISKEIYLRFVSIIDLSLFRSLNISILVRLNYFNNKIVTLINKIAYLFRHFSFKGFNSIFITINFALLIFSKDVVKFTIFLRTLLRYVDRKKQRKFFTVLSTISNSHVSEVLEKYNIYGLFIKVSGKVGGFAGDRTKFFFVKYKSTSRSIRENKYNFYQKQLNTKNGTASITTLLLFK